MRFDRLTIKAREAIENARTSSARAHHAEWTSLHLLYALCDQQDGIVGSLLDRIGVKAHQVKNQVKMELDRMPKVSGADPSLSLELNNIFETSQSLAVDMKDDYVSTEHFILAMVHDNCKAKEVLSPLGVKYDDLLHALVDVRGNQRVTTENPETTFEVGIQKTIKWYLDNMDWMKNVTSGEYQKYYEKMYSKK